MVDYNNKRINGHLVLFSPLSEVGVLFLTDICIQHDIHREKCINPLLLSIYYYHLIEFVNVTELFLWVQSFSMHHCQGNKKHFQNCVTTLYLLAPSLSSISTPRFGRILLVELRRGSLPVLGSDNNRMRSITVPLQ